MIWGAMMASIFNVLVELVLLGRPPWLLPLRRCTEYQETFKEYSEAYMEYQGT